MDKYSIHPFNINGQATYTLRISNRKMKIDREVYKASDVAELAKRILEMFNQFPTTYEETKKCIEKSNETITELEAIAEGEDG